MTPDQAEADDGKSRAGAPSPSSGLVFQSSLAGGSISSFLELPRAPGCESRSLVGFGNGKTYVVPLRCSSWGCRRCAARMTTLWANRVQEAKCERFCTFTNIGQTREEIRYTFQHIIRDFRRAGKVFEYWGVVELHKSGKPHMHCIQSGSYMPRYLWKGVIEKNGWGHNDIRRCWDGLDAARYCAKHLCHSHGRRWTGRLIRYSKGFFPETAKEHKEQFRELGVDWQMCFGRADRVANFLETRGLQVEPGVLGVDWIQPEKMVKNEIRLSVPRVGRLGYVIHDKSWDEVLRRSTDGFSGDESASVWPSVPSRDEAAAAAVDSLCE